MRKSQDISRGMEEASERQPRAKLRDLSEGSKRMKCDIKRLEMAFLVETPDQDAWIEARGSLPPCRTFRFQHLHCEVVRPAAVKPRPDAPVRHAAVDSLAPVPPSSRGPNLRSPLMESMPESPHFMDTIDAYSTCLCTTSCIRTPCSGVGVSSLAVQVTLCF